MIRAKVSSSYATVGAREDIDGAVPLVTFCPNRQADDPIELTMDARTARALARRLNRWARALDPPKGRR